MRFASSLRGLTATGFVLLALSGCGADNGVNPLPASGSTAGAGAGGTTTPPAGGGTGGTGGSGGTTTPPPDATSIVRSWYGIQANILQPFCVTCHQGAAQFAAGLSWEVGQYEAIVTNGRLSTEIATMLEVNPNNPDASYLMWKLRGQGPAGEPIVGVRMPATGIALDPALITAIQEWIAAGAPLGDPADATSGGSTGGGGSGGTTNPPPDPTAIVPTWYGVQANILQPFCVTCHQGAAQFAAGLSWEVGQYEAIVTNGRLSTEIATLLEVNPSNPDASYLMWKLRGQGPAGEPIVGVRMPATGVALDPALISVVQQWIANGAPLGDPADATAGGGTGTPSFPVGSWMHVWSNTLQVCTLCHSNTPSSDRCGVEFECPPKGVVLTSDNYAGVVDGDEVRPFRLDGSKLWERVIDPDPSKRMPFEMPPLTAEQLQIIEDWILDGAPFCPAGEPLDACTP